MKIWFAAFALAAAVASAEPTAKPLETGLDTLHGCKGCAAYFGTAPKEELPPIGGTGEEAEPKKVETGLDLLRGCPDCTARIAEKRE
jgi:hypothetical protein